MSGRRRWTKATQSSMYSSSVNRWKSPGVWRYSPAMSVPRMICSWWILSVVMGSSERRSACKSISCRLSPGRPSMIWAPTMIPAWWVRQIVATLSCQVCPRWIRSSVLSQVLSTPYSISRKVRLESSPRWWSRGSGMQSGRVPMISPTTSGCDRASSYLAIQSATSP